MDTSGVDVPLQTLLGAHAVEDLFALFESHPGLVGERGMALLGDMAEYIVSEPHRQWSQNLYVVASAWREHGRRPLAREYARIGVTRIHDDFAGYWPVLMLNLGVTYLNGEPGEAAPDIERAIATFTGLLRIIGPGDHPETWAQAKINLARTVLKRPHRDLGEGLQLMINSLWDACDATSPTLAPLAWAEANAELGTTLANFMEEHDVAIERYRNALTVYAPETDWGWWTRTQANLANTLLKRSKGGPDPEEAVTLLEAILTRSEEGMGAVPASVFAHLGNAFLHRARGSYAENREQAIAHLTRALELPGDRELPAVDWCNLGIAYRDRVHGDRAVNSERAIECFGNALACQDAGADPEAWAATQAHLAYAYLFRLRGTRADNIEAAIRCARDALERTALDSAPDGRDDALNALGMAYLRRETGDRAADIEQAIGCLEKAAALAAGRGDLFGQARILSNLGSAYASRIGGDADENLEIGLRHFQSARTVLDGRADDPAGARNLWNLGHALLARRSGDPDENLERAAKCFRDAEASGVLRLDTAARLRRHLAEAQALLTRNPLIWPVIMMRLDAAFDLLAERWDESVTPEGRRELIAAISRAGRWSALACVADGDHARGLERLEASRAIALREALALDDLQSGDIPQPQREAIAAARRRVVRLRAEAGAPEDAAGRYLALAEELTAAQTALTAALAGLPERPRWLSAEAILAAIPAGATLIVPVATEFGGLFYVVPSGTARIEACHVVDAPYLTSEVVRHHLGIWLPAYSAAWAAHGNGGSGQEFERRWQAASQVLEEMLDWVGDAVMAPIFERIAEIDPEPQPDGGMPELVIMPTGEYALFPFHAAAYRRDGERRRVMEDYAVSYTPSLQALRTARSRQARMVPGGQELLAFLNPTNDLRFSESVELPALRRLFPAAGADAVRVGAAATKAALRDEARGRRYVHLSCHGRFDHADPEQSGLQLAGHEWLTAREIVAEVDLDGCRWVMLSACETGMTDVVQAPDEAAGLVAAFQMAGAPCVLASLWTVPDRSTALFVAKVYDEHLASGLSPAQALRRAALWLKDLPAEALRALPEPEDGAMDGGAPRFAEIGAKAGEPDGMPARGAQPFVSPLFWAPFAVWGV